MENSKKQTNESYGTINEPTNEPINESTNYSIPIAELINNFDNYNTNHNVIIIAEPISYL